MLKFGRSCKIWQNGPCKLRPRFTMPRSTSSFDLLGRNFLPQKQALCINQCKLYLNWPCSSINRAYFLSPWSPVNLDYTVSVRDCTRVESVQKPIPPAYFKILATNFRAQRKISLCTCILNWILSGTEDHSGSDIISIGWSKSMQPSTQNQVSHKESDRAPLMNLGVPTSILNILISSLNYINILGIGLLHNLPKI